MNHSRHFEGFLKRCTASISLIFASMLIASAQTVHSDNVGSATGAGGTSAVSLESANNEFGIWAASSLGLPSALGASRDDKFPIMIGLRYGRILLTSSFVSLEYTADVVPVSIVSQPKGASISAAPGSSTNGRDHIYGVGVAPVGVKFLFGSNKRIKPFVAASSGPFYFSKPVPVAEATHFNFFSSGDIGVNISISDKKAIVLGYKIGHASNAGTSRINPGFNSSSVFIGFSIFK